MSRDSHATKRGLTTDLDSKPCYTSEPWDIFSSIGSCMRMHCLRHFLGPVPLYRSFTRVFGVNQRLIVLRRFTDSSPSFLDQTIVMFHYFKLVVLLPLKEVEVRSLGASTSLSLINKRLKSKLVNSFNLEKFNKP